MLRQRAPSQTARAITAARTQGYLDIEDLVREGAPPCSRGEIVSWLKNGLLPQEEVGSAAHGKVRMVHRTAWNRFRTEHPAWFNPSRIPLDTFGKALGLSRSGIHRWRMHYGMPAHLIKKRAWVLPTEVLNWIVGSPHAKFQREVAEVLRILEQEGGHHDAIG